ncbi:MAG: hypothetical protein ACYC8T_06605 [Myxococcaceae bacterium]
MRLPEAAVVGVVLSVSFGAQSADAPDAGESSTLARVRKAPVVALLKLNRGQADCTGIGHYHMVLDVVTARPGRRVRTAHHDRMLYEQNPEKRTYFVAGLEPKRWVPKSHQCLPGSMATDSKVLAMVPVKDEAEGRALIELLRPKAR